MTKSKNSKKLVAIIMGSKTDYPIMKGAEETLYDFGVNAHVEIVSAHRTPEKMFQFAKSAHKKGFKIIIAGAGGAAHLPGMVASLTPLPVIGVPIQVGSLQGLDALLSIAQMPKGIPVATVAVDNSTNAGLLALRILATSSPGLTKQILKFQNNQKKLVSKMNSEIPKNQKN